MSLQRKIKQRTLRRQRRVRARLNTLHVPRISVFRSINNIYAQIIDDTNHATLVSCSTIELKDLSGDKKVKAKAVGLELAKRALEKGIKAVVFDRGSYLFHGRVKNLAEGLRDGGLQV